MFHLQATVSRSEPGEPSITLKAGDTFGDLAFLGINKRPSTVITASRCECIVVNVADYRQISGSLSIEDKFKFLASTELFQDWDPYQLYRLALVLKDMNAAKGSVLAEQGEMSNVLYFILSGAVGVQCVVSAKSHADKLLSSDGYSSSSRKHDLTSKSASSSRQFTPNHITNIGANGFFGELAVVTIDNDRIYYRGVWHTPAFF